MSKLGAEATIGSPDKCRPRPAPSAPSLHLLSCRPLSSGHLALTTLRCHAGWPGAVKAAGLSLEDSEEAALCPSGGLMSLRLGMGVQVLGPGVSGGCLWSSECKEGLGVPWGPLLPSPCSSAPPSPLIYKPYVPVSPPAPTVCSELQLLPLITQGAEVLEIGEGPRASGVQGCSVAPLPALLGNLLGLPMDTAGPGAQTLLPKPVAVPIKKLTFRSGPRSNARPPGRGPQSQRRTFKEGTPERGSDSARSHSRHLEALRTSPQAFPAHQHGDMGRTEARPGGDSAAPSPAVHLCIGCLTSWIHSFFIYKMSVLFNTQEPGQCLTHSSSSVNASRVDERRNPQLPAHV